MPSRSKQPCGHPLCTELTTTTYCDKHKQDKRISDQYRGSFRARGYDSRWDKVRALKVKRNPLCEVCLEVGKLHAVEIVHHIKTVRDRPDLLLEMDNLQSVCRSCHAKIHASDH